MTTDPAAFDPEAVYALVGQLVRRLNPRAANCRIVFDTPGGAAALPVALPADEADDLEAAILDVCGRLRPADRLRGKAIAAEVDRGYDSYFRAAVSRLVKAGRLLKDDRGYGPAGGRP